MSEFSKNLAVIIGINDYQNGISPLKTAVPDAKKVCEILRLKHEYRTWILLDDLATLQNITRLLEKTLPQQVGESDRLIFYFAGHGIALNGEDGPEGYLIPQDAKLGDTDSYLPMTQLHSGLSELPCRHFLGLLDCCFAGAFRWSSTRHIGVVPEVIHRERYDRFIADPAWQVITSAASDQKAADAFNFNTKRGQKGDHSPFAAALIEALEGRADAYPPASEGKPPGDGIITATELYLYLRDAVEVPSENYSRQTPGLHPLKKHDKGEYIFLAPGHPLNLPPAPPLDASKNPYRGLKAFEEKHSELFFGRTELTKKLFDFVNINPLTVVLGASGSGKSSLVKAGLISKLKKAGSQQWKILSIRPGEAPFKALNNALKLAQFPEVNDSCRWQDLVQSISSWGKTNPNWKILLFIDQSEEIITLCKNEEERKAFFKQILAAINAHGGQLRVVLSLRSDFEPQVRDAGLKFLTADNQIGKTQLTKSWQNGRFIVPAMTRGGLREAIEKPAEKRVMYFQPHELVEQLIDEVADMPGALPLLSFALSELYLKYLQRQREAENRGETIDRSLTQEDYENLGGVIQSLTQRADDEYKKLVEENPAYDKIIRHVMLRMVAVGGGELARRRVPLYELEYPPEKNDWVKTAIARFTEARLLVEGQDADGNPYVEPAHDALVRGWQRLLMWKQEEEENLLLQRRLTPAAQEWETQQKPKFLWNANPRLDLLKKVRKSDDNWLNKVEDEFVRRSVGRRSFNARRNWGIAIVVMIGLGTGLVFSFIGQRNALIGQIRSSVESSKANSQSNRNLEALNDALRASFILKESWLLKNLYPEKDLIDELKLSLHTALYTSRQRNQLNGHIGTVNSIQFSPDGQRLVSGSNDNTVKIWNVNGELVDTLQGKYDSVRNISISPDGEIIAAVNHDRTITLWSSHGVQIKTIKADIEGPGYSIGVADLDFSPDGKIIVVPGVDGRVRLVNLDEIYAEEEPTLDGKPILEEKGDEVAENMIPAFINEVVFSPDGKIIASAGYDQTIKLWTREGKPLTTLDVNRDGTKPEWGWYGQLSCAFSPNGEILASGGENGKIELWNWRDKKRLIALEGHTGAINSIKFSPDGQIIASASADQTIKLWSLDGNLIATFEGHTDAVNSISFSPEGKLIASASDDNSIKIWNVNFQYLIQFKTHNSINSGEVDIHGIRFGPDSQFIASVATDENGRTVKLWTLDGTLIEAFESDGWGDDPINFSPDGELMAVVNGKTIQLWNQKNATITHILEHSDSINNVTFSPNGKLIASVNQNHAVKIWNRGGEEVKTFDDMNGRSTDGRYGDVTFHPNGELIASTYNDNRADIKQIKVRSIDGNRVDDLKGHTDNVASVNFSPDGQVIASISWDLTVKLWNLEGEEIATWEWYDHDRSLAAGPEELIGSNGSLLMLSPDSQKIITPGEDETFKVWDLKGNLLQILQGERPLNGLNKIDFLPNSSTVALARGNKLQFWNIEDRELISESEINNDDLLDIDISKNGKFLATIDENGTVNVLSLDLDQLLDRGCDRIRDYLQTNPNVEKSDRTLCDP